MDAVGISIKPIDKTQKLELLRNYIYKVELSDFVDVIRADFLNFGLILSQKWVIGRDSASWASSSSFAWLTYEQFRLLFYIKCESLLEEENINKLRRFVNATSTWQGPFIYVNIMKEYFMQIINKKIKNQDAKWLQELLCFWTSKTHCIPQSGLIHVLTKYKGRPRVTSSACFNQMEFPSYMAQNGIETFEDILDESIKSLKHGFTTY